MHQNNTDELDRQQCLIFKAQIVASMTPEVKLKIAVMGYTPTEVASAYLMRKFDLSENDYRLIDTNSLNIKHHFSLPNYRSIVFNDSGTKIVDVLF
jgi:hypothetical protein